MEQRQEVRNDVVDMVSNEHLVTIELDLVPLDGHPVIDLREIQDTCQVERIVHVQMDIEKRILVCRVQRLVEVHVVFFLQVGRLACPQRLYCIDNLVFIRVDIFAVFPFLILAEHDRERHELAVFAKQLPDFSLSCIFCRIIVKVQCDGRASVCLPALAHLIFRAAVARPHHRFCAVFP